MLISFNLLLSMITSRRKRVGRTFSKRKITRKLYGAKGVCEGGGGHSWGAEPHITRFGDAKRKG